MRYLFDKDSNSLSITFAEGRRYRDSAEISDGVVVDFDTDGRPYSIEFLRADEVLDITGLVSGRPTQFAPTMVDTPELDGESLRRWRNQLGLSQRDLAGLLQVAPEVVDQWESGTREIEYAGLLRLALQAIEGNVTAAARSR